MTDARDDCEQKIGSIAAELNLQEETREVAVDCLDAAEPGHIADQPFTTAAAALYAASLITNEQVSVRTIGKEANIQPEPVRDRALRLVEGVGPE